VITGEGYFKSAATAPNKKSHETVTALNLIWLSPCPCHLCQLIFCWQSQGCRLSNLVTQLAIVDRQPNWNVRKGLVRLADIFMRAGPIVLVSWECGMLA